MDCTEFRRQLNDYVDGKMSDWASMAEHERACAACARQVAIEREFRASLRALATEPVDDAGRADRLLAPVRHNGDAARRRRVLTVASAAVAASLALGVVIGMHLSVPEEALPGAGSVQLVALEPDREQAVRLVFRSPGELKGARIHLLASENVELAGFPGQRELSWETDLSEGANLLELPVTLRGAEGSLVATVTHGQAVRTFNIRLRPKTQEGQLLSRPARRIAAVRYNGERHA